MAAARDRERRWKEHDFYQVLGVPREASAADVKKGFRKVALTCHPDKVPEEERAPATRRFQLIAEAYEVLSQDATRQLYNKAQPNAGRSFRPQARAQQRPAAAAEPPQRREPQRQEPSAAWGWAPSWAQRSQPQTKPPRRRTPERRQRRPPPGRPGAAGGGQGPRCEGCDEHCRVADLRKCPQCPNLICPRCDLCAGCIPVDQSSSDESEGPHAPKPGAWRAQREAPQPRQEVPRRPPSPPRPEPPRPDASAAPSEQPTSAVGARTPQPYSRGPGSRPEAVGGASTAQQPPHTARAPGPQRPEPAAKARERQAPTSARSEQQAPVSARGPATEPAAAGGTGPKPAQAPASRPQKAKGDDLRAGKPEMPRGFGRRESGFSEESGWQAEESNGAEVWRRANSKPESGFRMDGPMDRRGRQLESPESSQTEEEEEEEGSGPGPSTADPESDKPLDMAAILMAMGFKEEEVKAALERMSSIEAAVEYLMQRTGESQKEDFGAALAGAAAGVQGLAARFGQRISSIMPWASKTDDQPLRIEAPWKKSPQDQLVSDLQGLGYSQGTAREAARRCSSVEAAVEWLAVHHPAG